MHSSVCFSLFRTQQILCGEQLGAQGFHFAFGDVKFFAGVVRLGGSGGGDEGDLGDGFVAAVAGAGEFFVGGLELGEWGGCGWVGVGGVKSVREEV